LKASAGRALPREIDTLLRYPQDLACSGFEAPVTRGRGIHHSIAVRRAVSSISLISCAKVNLGLRVLRKRPDGFHDIQTVLQTIDLHDRVRISSSRSEKIRVRCEHPEVPSGSENLAYQAARLLREELQVKKSCSIEIIKNIPPGAGLGGGSSNAAATLVGLRRLWKLNLPEAKLLELGEKLGSDVPFFLYGGTVLAEGRGERLTPLHLVPDFWMTLVKPNLSIATGWAYGQVKIPLTSNPLYVKLNSLKEISTIEQLLSYLDNDLERAVEAAYPSIDEIKRELLSKGAMGAAMSGSGSAVLGVVKTKKAAVQLAERVKRASWQVFVVRPARRCEGLGEFVR
jgi:4-diphosphocytidyl-2-C-methyl-D-erythritol kinase